jgi:hypothetical protein
MINHLAGIKSYDKPTNNTEIRRLTLGEGEGGEKNALTHINSFQPNTS